MPGEPGARMVTLWSFLSSYRTYPTSCPECLAWSSVPWTQGEGSLKLSAVSSPRRVFPPCLLHSCLGPICLCFHSPATSLLLLFPLPGTLSPKSRLPLIPSLPPVPDQTSPEPSLMDLYGMAPAPPLSCSIFLHSNHYHLTDICLFIFFLSISLIRI